MQKLINSQRDRSIPTLINFISFFIYFIIFITIILIFILKERMKVTIEMHFLIIGESPRENGPNFGGPSGSRVGQAAPEWARAANPQTGKMPKNEKKKVSREP